MGCIPSKKKHTKLPCYLMWEVILKERQNRTEQDNDELWDKWKQTLHNKILEKEIIT